MAMLRLLSATLLITAGFARLTWAGTLTCPEGYTLVGTKCYHTSTDQFSQSNAIWYCGINNGSIAVIGSKEENDLLKESFLTTTVYLGIILRDKTSLFKLQLEATGHLGYTDLDPDSNVDCLVADKTKKFQWTHSNCEEPHAALCSTPALVATPKLCDEESHKFGEDTCFWASPLSTLSYNYAAQACATRGMTLASVHSAAENRFIEDIITFPHSWLGLKSVESGGAFEWTDGTPTDYENWGPGEPSASTECAGMFRDHWADYSCTYAKMSVVCRGVASPVAMPTGGQRLP